MEKIFITYNGKLFQKHIIGVTLILHFSDFIRIIDEFCVYTKMLNPLKEEF